MSLKDLALQRALGMLKGAGVVFVVVDGDKVHTSTETQYIIRKGEVYLTSEVLPNAKRSSPSAPRRDWKFTGYVEALPLLNVGDAWSYESASAEDAKALQRSVTSTAHALWGSGNYMTSVTGTTLEVLRLV